MSMIQPSPTKIEALRIRWLGQEARLRAIAKALRAGEDWTVHLKGLPFVHEVPPLAGEACGRDLRGADLKRWLRPEVDVRFALEHEAGIVAAITMEALRTNTALPDVTPFPVEGGSAEEISVAMRRGDRFLLARCDSEPVGVMRLAERREYHELVGAPAYVEVSGLAVLPAWRRGGIGTRLLEAGETAAVQAGFGFAMLRTTLELGLVSWYERLGYAVRTTRQLSYPGSPTFLDVLMVRKLPGRARRPQAPRIRTRIVRNTAT
jgi:GNAT superfamily N-acetyltransferase